MEVLAHKTGEWFLLKSNNRYFLDVNCNYSIASTSLSIELNQEEFDTFCDAGYSHIGALASKIQSNFLKYQTRDVSQTHSRTINDAIKQWHATQNVKNAD